MIWVEHHMNMLYNYKLHSFDLFVVSIAVCDICAVANVVASLVNLVPFVSTVVFCVWIHFSLLSP